MPGPLIASFKPRAGGKRRLLVGLLSLVVLCAAGFALVALAYWSVERNAQGRVYDEVESLPKQRVALLLGTAPRIPDGRPNLYFEHRVAATIALFEAQKIERVLVSGDHGTKGYNEPEAFRVRLEQAGVEASRIHLDFAGFRTLDSVVRAKEVFGQKELLVISQEFHNARALYLADHFGIAAIGYNARGVGGRAGLKNLLRESLARVKLFFDLLVGVEPRFLGDKIELPGAPSLP